MILFLLLFTQYCFECKFVLILVYIYQKMAPSGNIVMRPVTDLWRDMTHPQSKWTNKRGCETMVCIISDPETYGSFGVSGMSALRFCQSLGIQTRRGLGALLFPLMLKSHWYSSWKWGYVPLFSCHLVVCPSKILSRHDCHYICTNFGNDLACNIGFFSWTRTKITL